MNFAGGAEPFLQGLHCFGQSVVVEQAGLIEEIYKPRGGHFRIHGKCLRGVAHNTPSGVVDTLLKMDRIQQSFGIGLVCRTAHVGLFVNILAGPDSDIGIHLLHEGKLIYRRLPFPESEITGSQEQTLNFCVNDINEGMGLHRPGHLNHSA